jgi:hypothetical protein
MKHDLDGRRRRDEKPVNGPAAKVDDLRGAFQHLGVSAEEAAKAFGQLAQTPTRVEPKGTNLIPFILTGLVLLAVIGGAAWKSKVEPILTPEPHHLVDKYRGEYPLCGESEYLWWDDLRNSWACAMGRARRQDLTMAELPVNCDPGRLFWVTDGVDRADCTYGGGAGEHWCICTSEGTLAALD